MPDRQIKPLGTEAAPAAYPIASSADLMLKLAFANYDGAGAAGSFKPCLRIVSDAGTIVGEAVADDAIAAGASADVSWFPFVGRGATVSTGGGTVWASLPGPAFVTIPAISGGSPGVALLPGDQTSFYTNTGAAWTTATHVDGGTTYHGLAANEQGHYLIKAQMALRPNTGAGLIEANMVNFGSDTPASYGSEGRFFNQAAGGSTQDGWYLEALFTVTAGAATPSGPWLLQVSNSTTQPIQAFVDMVGIQLDTNPTAIV